MQIKKIKFGGLFRTIFLASMLCMLGPVVLVSIISIRALSNNLSSTVMENLQQLSVEKANEVNDMIQNQVAITKAVAQSSYIEEEVTKGANPNRLIEYLGKIGKNASGLYENFFITKMEAGYADCLGGATLHPVTGEPWYEACLKSGEFLGNNISPVTGRPVYVISYGIYNNGKFVGALNNSIDLAVMTKSITGSISDPAKKVMIVDTAGNIIASQKSEQILKVNLNKENESTAKVMKKMLSSKSGIIEFQLDNTLNIGSFNKMGTMYTLVYMPKSVYTKMISIVVRKIAFAIAGGVLLVMVIIFLISLSITTPISVVDNSIQEIATGNADLTKRIDIKAKHEVKSLVNGFNKFAEKLQSIINDLKSASTELMTVGEELQNSTFETESSITEILSNIESVNKRILAQADIVDSTTDALSSISANLGNLESMIRNQSGTVNSASRQVEDMLNNIENVNSLIENMTNDFDTLKADVQIGNAKQKDVTELVHKIEAESKILQDANVVIASIASQTNLLAMNAAIESAHAGEAGKGFSVVADEIRKLSENSTHQSKIIGEQLKEIVNSISTVVKASSESQASISEISDKIQKTNESVHHIHNAMQQQHESSRQINAALNQVTSSTDSVLASSSEISGNSRMILNDLQQLQDSSIEMKDSIAEMQIGAQKINQTGEELSEITVRVKETISKSNSQIEKFTV